MNRSIRLLLCLYALGAGMSAAAETQYVIDQLLVGIHAEKNLDSAILKVLPTGSVLEVIERDGELALVEDSEKVRGWVDAAYLTENEPAARRLKAALDQIKKLEADLTQAREGAVTAAVSSGEGNPAALESMMKENTELKAKLSEERLKSGEMQSELANLRAEVDSQTTPPDARIVELEREHERLLGVLDNAEEKVAELSARASLSSTSELVPLVLKEYAMIVAVIVLLLLIVGFGGGIYLVDLLNRRRHGGFRV